VTAPASPILFYDGECGVCTSSVRFILRRDRRGELRFASLRGGHGAALLAHHPELRGVDSMLWVEPSGGVAGGERISVRSDAALAVARYLGGGWRLLTWLAWMPRKWRDGLYDWVARNRRRWAGTDDACEIPSPAERERFLDLA
jgi:predicted DCC family thiol-disulfide oxidoreductase YuxK